MSSRSGGQRSDEQTRRAIAEADRLNEEFFQATPPGAYFRERAAALLRHVDGGDTLLPAASEGSLRKAMSDRLGDWTLTVQEGSDAAHQAYKAIEVTSLAYHATEAVLRQFDAHHDLDSLRPAWMNLVSTQSEPSAFREWVKKMLACSDAELNARIERVFLPPDFAAVTAEFGGETVDEAKRVIALWLRYFGQHLLDMGNVYNSTKHGLGSIPRRGRRSMFVEHPPASGEYREFGLIDGSTVDTLEYVLVANPASGGKKTRTWVRVRREIDLPGFLASTMVAAALLDWMWEVAKARALTVSVEVPVSIPPPPNGVVKVAAKWTRRVEALPLPPSETQRFLRE